MTPRYEFAILGGSRLAGLLCGLLAHRHGRQVLRIADPMPRHRLPRGFDVALPLATRPGSWRMVQNAARETADLLLAIDAPDRLDRIDMRLVADLPETATALAHLTHVAAGYGVSSRGGVFRGIARFSGEVDLANSAVQTVETARVSLSSGSSGTELELDGETVRVAQIVLADDTAILDLLAEGEPPFPLAVEPSMATLTVPTRRLPAPIVRYLDRGVTLAQNEDHCVLALVAGQKDADARLASCLAGALPLQRRATTRYRRLATMDGAPLIGRLEPSGPFVVAGLGSCAAFFAPAIARLLAGEAEDEEAAWFAAHDPLAANRAAIADIAEMVPR